MARGRVLQLALVALIGTVVLVGGTAPARTTQIPVGQSTQRITVGKTQRTFRVYRPAQLASPTAVVVMLHGGFGSARQAETSYGWDAQAAKSHFLVLYPDGLDRAWNTEGGGCCGTPYKQHVDDVGFISAAVKQVQSQLRIDPRRIYATGISNGGIMDYTLACRTKIFAAIGPDSATELASCPSPQRLSVIHIHGTADTRIPYDGSQGEGAAHIDGPPVPDTNAAWRATDGCAAPVVTTSGVVTTSLAKCPKKRAVELISIAGAGHQWPGAQQRTVLAGDPPSTALDATRTIWAFFAAHPAPRPAVKHSRARSAASAPARIAFTRTDGVYVAAADGSGARRLVKGHGLVAGITPDGGRVLYGVSNGGQSFTQTLWSAGTAGGSPRALLHERAGDLFAMSPNGRYVAALSGDPDSASRTAVHLLVVNLSTGSHRTIARGGFRDFDGASFSPDSSKLVYSHTLPPAKWPVSNLYIAGVAARSVTRRITTDGKSTAPVWGPSLIAYSHWSGTLSYPHRNVWLVHTSGTQPTALTKNEIGEFDGGLDPEGWSADGSRLLARYEGADVYGIVVDVASGREYRFPKNIGLELQAISKDGSTVLGYEGAVRGHEESDVVTRPATGGA